MLAELQRVSKWYDHQVLNDISLTVRSGDSIAVMGPSGSGKSTLLNILGTLDEPTTGNVILNGSEVDFGHEGELAGIRNRFIGFVFQLHYLLPQLTILENVLLPTLPVREREKKVIAGQRALRLLGKAGLAGMENRFPGTLSVGECQRVAVVRALINKPGLLLADEPTGSLDEEHAQSLGDLLVELNREEGMAMVVVTHSPELASRMGTRYRLRTGRLEPIVSE